MSQGLNKVILIGAVAEPPRLRQTGEGTPRLELRLHTTERYQDGAGVERESHGWHDVVVYGRRAEALERFLSKGRRIAIEGRLHGYRTTKSDPPRWKTEVVAKEVVLLGGPSASEEARSAA